MKLIASGVAICAGIMRSPSFSRDSSSTRMNMRPLRASSMTASMGETISLKVRRQGSSVFAIRALLLFRRRQKSLNVAREHVDFQVDPVAGLLAAQGGHLGRVGDEVDPEGGAGHLVDRQRDTV